MRIVGRLLLTSGAASGGRRPKGLKLNWLPDSLIGNTCHSLGGEPTRPHFTTPVRRERSRSRLRFLALLIPIEINRHPTTTTGAAQGRWRTKAGQAFLTTIGGHSYRDGSSSSEPNTVSVAG